MKHFHQSAISGTLVATTTGVVFAWRAPATHQYIQAFRFELHPVVNAAGVAPVSMELALQDIFNTNYTGGTDVSDRLGAGSADYSITARIRDVQKVLSASQIPVSAADVGNIRIATTGALGGGGGGTPRTQPWAHSGASFPSAGGSPPLVLEWRNPTLGLEHEDPYQGCLLLAPDTGFVVRIPLNATALLTLQLSASVDFLE